MKKFIQICCFIVILCNNIYAQVDSTPNTLQPINNVNSSLSTNSSAPTVKSELKTSLTSTTPTLMTTRSTTSTINKKPIVNAECKKHDVKFAYTPCDEYGNRWKVQVPKEQNCHMKFGVPPEAGVPCSFSCKPGDYLDIDTQSCRQCMPGTYSVGDGRRIAIFDKLPEGFDTNGHDSDSLDLDREKICASAVWKPKGDYFESAGSSCRSTLRYKVDLVKPGNISFTVRSDDESSFFHVWVESSSTCASSYESPVSSTNNEMYYQMSTDWKTHMLDLEKGQNTVYFVAAYFRNIYDEQEESESEAKYETDSEKTVMMKNITVRGFMYSQECEPCEPGTYSSHGAAVCTACRENTFSSGNAVACVKCDNSKYAPEHSDKCYTRKKCTLNDYHSFWMPCKNGKSMQSYAWNKPHICNSDTGVKLPKPLPNVDCPSCNPGMENNGTDCLFCPKNTISDGKNGCKKCAPETHSDPGLFFNVWNKPSPHLFMYCIAKPTIGCSSKQGWVKQGSYISSGIGHSDDAELILYVIVDGFTKPSSTFKLEYSIEGCDPDSCRLKIETVGSGNGVHVIEIIEGNQPKSVYTYNRLSTRKIRYRIVFEKKYDVERQSFKYQSARVKIYSIEITHAINGGGRSCETCRSGPLSRSDKNECTHCPSGQFIDGDNCKKCPANTYLPEGSSDPTGIEVCEVCPTGTVSESGSTFCHSNCIMNLNGRSYNFTSLSGSHTVKGQKQFTTKGYSYYHMYNINFCGHPYGGSICKNNATSSSSDDAVYGALCRSTIIPDGDSVLSAQSMSVGKMLESIWVERKSNKNSTKGDLTETSESDVVKVKFYSPRITQVCKNGTRSVLRLVCDPNEDGDGKFTFGGEGCTLETCDGCNFEFTWRTKHACQICTVNDYQNITTSCKEGKKTMHYLWKEPRICYGGSTKPNDQEIECTIFEKSILDLKVVMFGFLLGAVLLAAGVIILCYRNRRLNYKYHRLVDSSYSKDGELPPAEMCALEDGEEDDDEIVLSRGKGKGSKLLDRIKGLKKSKINDFTEFETINLDSMKDLSDDDDDEL